MSSDPINIADDDASMDLELVWYAGLGGPRLALTRGSGSVDLSTAELSRLVHTAGVLRFVPSPYGIPEARASKAGADACSFCGNPADERRDVLVGPGVNICDGCMDLGRTVLEDARDPAPWRKPRDHQVNQPQPTGPLPFDGVRLGGDES
ncbi:ClpX C4-type zinc finger protein [Streptomyces collinus]|uniref:ATP-dependent protease ATP-binding subunit ClpX n=1 Tax=Streptomyces collinus (strain DSM 40733 / Tue 365) TaxID=1214242 RepID=S5V8S8_STRC3|nr:ClpX C4-type zinc finger protein [Streptomyces collinus]AGS73956.1 ATP-dependent protease ATP-binding subunit ClpX [Streptomyces collinus Tu 365]